ncbi:hypothetical protein [Ferruginibacter sp.]
MMKNVFNPVFFKYGFVLFILTVANAVAWAQDTTTTAVTTTNTSTKTTEQTWYAEPWVWVVGAAVLILLIIALTRGSSTSGRTDKVTVTKTSSTEVE